MKQCHVRKSSILLIFSLCRIHASFLFAESINMFEEYISVDQESMNEIEFARLINMETGHVILEIIQDKIGFFNPFMADEMKESGIYIPPSKSWDFEDKQIVYLDDPLFKKAFIHVYYPQCMANSSYEWQK